MPARAEFWQSVVDDAALLQQAAATDPRNVADLARLRKHHDAEQVAIAIELVTARQKLEPKFGEQAQAMVSDVAGAEQATSRRVADHKARRFAERLGGDGEVLDICCGIGGDAKSLADAKLGVRAYDLDPLRVWMCGVNGGGRVEPAMADAASLDPRGRAIHLDPARRAEGGRRLFKLDDYQPGPEIMGRLIAASGGAGIKLGPGIDLDTLPWPGEVEFISEQGRLVQAILWTGRLASETRSASLIDSGGTTHRLAGSPAALPLGETSAYVFTVDAAVERAGLLGNLARQLDANAVHPSLGLLTATRPIDSPWLTGFKVIQQLPWRMKKVKQWLSAHDAGIVEIKTRGKAVDPDQVARDLRGPGEKGFTVFVHRWDQQKLAMICERM